MATVIAITTLKLSDDQKKTLVKRTGEAVCNSLGLADKFKSIMLLPPLPDECYSENIQNQITFFVYSAPNKTTEQKRELMKQLNQVMLDLVGYQGEMKVVVIIKEHPDHNVGVDGVLREDIVKGR